ncbi:Hpt domain-containing protein [Pelagerythrobacter sp.]|uniref:Hpt domain-containing protein n=1 Tax=Pelagerythrobacter sp. TaxID=2800702 RepID=UPI0035B333EF
MNDIGQRLAALSARFAEQAGDTAAAIAAALEREDRQELASLCHSLSGRAGMFGHPAIGDAARCVEIAIDEGRPEGEVAELARDLLRQLASLGHGPAPLANDTVE